MNNWVFEISSGYRGYRNINTGEWIYESEYKKLMENANNSKKDK